jgi:hypothetical protein
MSGESCATEEKKRFLVMLVTLDLFYLMSEFQGRFGRMAAPMP